VDDAVASVLATFHIDPELVPASLEVHEMRLRFQNLTEEMLAGTLRLIPPPGWEVRPQSMHFALSAGEAFEGWIGLRLGYNEVAGPKAMEAVFELEGRRTARVRAEAPFRLGLADVEVASLAQVDGSSVIIRQMVTNRSGQAISFRGFVQAAGMPRQERLIARLAPDQTVVKEYVLRPADPLIGQPVRVGLKEIGGGRWLNQVVYPD
jgi:hypothetical protein